MPSNLQRRLATLERARTAPYTRSDGAAPEAWARLVDLYTPILLRYARGRGASDPDAADLVQDVFVVL